MTKGTFTCVLTLYGQDFGGIVLGGGKRGGGGGWGDGGRNGG